VRFLFIPAQRTGMFRLVDSFEDGVFAGCWSPAVPSGAFVFLVGFSPFFSLKFTV